ncbi:MAG: bacteriocin [Clostridioides sp.]|nr:bacteriocin [Clostridioides sp.]
MEKEVIQVFVSQGVFGVLFGYLLFYILKENTRREEEYQELLKFLSELVPEITVMRQDLSEIKEDIHYK